MSSLASITEKSRSILKIIAIIVGVGLILYFLFIIGGFIKNMLYPPTPPAPTQAFGTLPELTFTQFAPAGNEYLINNTTGKLPEDFPDRLPVYQLLQPKPNFLALPNARKTVAVAGFTNNETRIDNTTYQWTNPSSGATIQYNIADKTFTIQSNYQASQKFFTNTGFPSEEDIKDDAIEFLNTLGVSRSDLIFKDTSITYMTFNGTTLQKVENPFSAKMVKIDLYNPNITNEYGEYAVLYPDYPHSIISLVVSYPSQLRPVLLEAEVYRRNIQLDKSSTYYIKTPQEALEDLKNGMGYATDTNPGVKQILDIHLAYYLDRETDKYAQPIVVFESPDAIFYVPAVKSGTPSASVTPTSE